MATKTFKIGLSNTDKQNMAQDVYERVLALTFAEYDSSETYDTGDFVVYEDVLYQCKEDNVTGAWDSSKWEQATMQDILDDIEDAVAFVNDKANVDGNYPTMTVGVADNLSPYDEESGIKQHAPFNFQASGTNNGSDPTATVGALAIMSEKRGNTVCVNQHVHLDRLITTQTVSGVTFTNNNDGTVSVSGTASADISVSLVPTWKWKELVLGHKQLWLLNGFISGMNLRNDDNGYYWGAAPQNTKIIDVTTDYSSWDYNSPILLEISNGTVCNTKVSIHSIDLTQWFNGDIPEDLLAHPENFLRYYQGDLSYNEGTLVNANSRYLKAIGRNQLTLEGRAENKYVDPGNGALVIDYSYDASAFIKVIPNGMYYLRSIEGDAGEVWAAGYSSNSESSFVCPLYPVINGLVLIPANVQYVRLTIPKAYLNEYCFSLYYSGESGYNQYYPYEVLTNNDTGVEVLRSAGDVWDDKKPDGTITRRIGVVDLATLSWNKSSSYTHSFFYANLSDRKSGLNNNLLCDKYDLFSSSFASTFGEDAPDKSICFSRDANSTQIYIRDDSLTGTDEPSGTLYYELAEPTTEQGISYSENVAIDDFGTMSYEGTSGVPQGNALFYPVDYKAFIDTLHNYTDGDPSNLALNSELNTKFESYLKSLSGYNASETQVLKNVEGTLTWVTEE